MRYSTVVVWLPGLWLTIRRFSSGAACIFPLSYVAGMRDFPLLTEGHLQYLVKFTEAPMHYVRQPPVRVTDESLPLLYGRFHHSVVLCHWIWPSFILLSVIVFGVFLVQKCVIVLIIVPWLLDCLRARLKSNQIKCWLKKRVHKRVFKNSLKRVPRPRVTLIVPYWLEFESGD